MCPTLAPSVTTCLVRPYAAFASATAAMRKLDAVGLDTVTHGLEKGEHFQSMRAIVHQPRAGQYEAILEMDKHLTA